jgi:hypothetical protein
MPNLWMPGAERLRPSKMGGSPMGSSPARAIWHTTESPTGDRYFDGVGAYLVRQGTEPHMLWDPDTGRIGQYFAADRAGRAVGNCGLIRCNRTGKFTVQVEVLGYASKRPLLDGPCVGLEAILVWMDGLGISREWPAGPPPSAGHSGTRSKATWLTKGGHYGHSQVPGNSHTDPGSVDPARWVRPTQRVVRLQNVREAALRDAPGPAGTKTHPEDVLIVERALAAEGLLPLAWVDGSFGTKTRDAYKAWQGRLDYSGVDADGIPGEASLTRLGERQNFSVLA